MLNSEKQTEIALFIADETPRCDSTPDLQRRFRQMSEEAGADDFSLFLVSSAAAETRRLTPFIDAGYPSISKKTELAALTLGDRFARRVAGATQPCWWAEDDESLIAASLARCLWAERMPVPEGMGPALALPLLDERDQAGVMVMWGGCIALSMPALADTQARCLALFGRMMALRPAAPRTAPSISRREIECLKLTANGQTSEEIAATLGLSVHTANQYLTNSTQKLNAMNRMHAVAKALRLGLID